jgi:glycosyltransferase involved in cell wall biosynthesis
MESVFALSFKGKVFSELQDTGADVHWLGEVRISRPWSIGKARRRLLDLLQREHFDAVICHMPWAQFVFAPVVKKFRIPQVFWCHDIPQGTHWLERIAKFVRPDLAIANSFYTLERLPKLYRGVKSRVLYYPVSFPKNFDRSAVRKRIRLSLGLPNAAVVIVQASRMESWKGTHVLLSALGELHNVPSWTAVIAGGAQRPSEEKYLSQLKAQAESLGILDRIKFLGHYSDVDELFFAADIYCQANAAPEPFGIVFVEALYAGLPVVTISTGGAAEVVNDSCGWKAPLGDIKALSSSLKTLVEDSDLREKLASSGPERAKMLCEPKKQITELYRILLELVR